jgi:hypothetical protein
MVTAGSEIDERAVGHTWRRGHAETSTEVFHVAFAPARWDKTEISLLESTVGARRPVRLERSEGR